MYDAMPLASTHSPARVGTRKENVAAPTDDVAAVLCEPDILTAVVDAGDVQDELVPQNADGW